MQQRRLVTLPRSFPASALSLAFSIWTTMSRYPITFKRASSPSSFANGNHYAQPLALHSIEKECDSAIFHDTVMALLPNDSERSTEFRTCPFPRTPPDIVLTQTCEKDTCVHAFTLPTTKMPYSPVNATERSYRRAYSVPLCLSCGEQRNSVMRLSQFFTQ